MFYTSQLSEVAEDFTVRIHEITKVTSARDLRQRKRKLTKFYKEE